MMALVRLVEGKRCGGDDESEGLMMRGRGGKT